MCRPVLQGGSAGGISSRRIVEIKEAANSLAALYEEGFGVSKDVARAVHWYQLAADQGLAEAQFRLGMMTELGRGVTRNDQEAVRWYTRAAEQNYAYAQSRLGFLYLTGKGVPQDNIKAYFWLTLAPAGSPNRGAGAREVNHQADAGRSDQG